MAAHFSYSQIARWRISKMSKTHPTARRAKRVKNFRGQRKTHILLDLSEHWLGLGYWKFNSWTLMTLPIQKGKGTKTTSWPHTSHIQDSLMKERQNEQNPSDRTASKTPSAIDSESIPLLISTGFLKYSLELKKNQLELKKKFSGHWKKNTASW